MRLNGSGRKIYPGRGTITVAQEFLEIFLHIIRKIWYSITDSGTLDNSKDSNSRIEATSEKRRQNNSRNDVDISDSDMVKRLKILMSIPISSADYPNDDLDAFLEKICDDKVKASKAEARRNEFALYRGRLAQIRRYAQEKNKIRVKDGIASLLNSLSQKNC